MAGHPHDGATSGDPAREDRADDVIASYLQAIDTPAPGADQPTLQYIERPSGDTKPMPSHCGGYELLEEIARGGMGVVYKARQVTPNRTVAIKMILAGQLATTQDVKRFQIEAEAAAGLDHPYIAPIYQVGQHDGQHYLAMAFVEGPSLAVRVAQGTLPPRAAAEIVRAVAEAVHYAHEKGIIHRDLKPGNILLDEKGRPQITDFGLAKLTDSASGLTGTGQILGTPSYMPPEQALANFDQVGPASDIYSLGAVLYCLVTGRPPFQAASTIDTLVQVLEQEPVSPRQFNAIVPRDLEAICLKCLRKEPEQRYASAAELAADLGRFLVGKPVSARRIGGGERIVRWVKRRPATAALLGLAVVAVGVGANLAVQAAQRAASRRQAQISIEELLIAQPAAVPHDLEHLRPLKEFALPLLRQRLSDVSLDGTRRLRAAYALADEGEAPLTFLLDAIPTAPPAECRNLLAAIEHVQASALPGLLDLARSWNDRAKKSRYAIVALQLGDPTAAQEALALRGDPMDRAAFIETYANWHGELRRNLRLLRDTDDEAFRSGMCTALGAIPREELDSAEIDVVTESLIEIFRHAPDGGTHSASAWALARFGRTLPPIERTSSAPSGRRWFVNRQGMTLVEVPAGEFEMGLPQAESDELPLSTPQHHVRLANRFYVGAYEVTQGQYQEIMGINPSHFSEHGAGKGSVAAGGDTRQYPVEMVTWFDAVDFCNKLSDKEGLPPYYGRVGQSGALLHGNGYRLPTEAEWEFASRGGTSPAWSLGDEERNLTDHAWFKPDSQNATHNIGELPPNPYGLHDLYGNVDEWCWDWVADYAPNSVTDPLGPSLGVNRVLRGCAVDCLAQGVRSAHRSGKPPSERTSNHGFRVARDVEVNDVALIASNLGFAEALVAQGNLRDALPNYGRAIETLERLAPEKLRELATRDFLYRAENGLGNAQQRLGDYHAALASHEKALPIAQERVAEQPQKIEYEISLAGTYCNIGHAQNMLERTDDALRSYGLASTLLEGVLGRDPQNSRARLFLRNTCWGHAGALGRLGRHAEVAENLRKAVELDGGENLLIRVGYAESLARAGDHVAAAAEARQLSENRQLTGDNVYVLARALSISAAAVARDDASLSETYAVEAVNLLRRTQRAGWITDAPRLRGLSQDPNLSCLRERDDFRKLVAEEARQAAVLQPILALPAERQPQALADAVQNHAIAQQWPEVRLLLEQLIRREPNNYYHWFQLGILYVFLDDESALRELTAYVATNFATQSDPFIRERLTKVFALAMDRVADLQVPAAWLESVHVNTPPPGLEPWNPFVAALVDLAQKQTAAALTHLERVEAANPNFVLLRASCSFARSLALAAQGDRAAAADAYASGLFILWTQLPHRATDRLDIRAYDWHEYLVTRVLCRRAEQQLFGHEQTDGERYRTLVAAREARAARGDDPGPPIRHPREVLKPIEVAASWALYVHEGAKGSLDATDNATVFHADAITDNPWHVQAFQVGIDLADGKEYVLKFNARASKPRSAQLVVGIDHEDWHSVGVDEKVSLTEEFRPFAFTFRAHDAAQNQNRVGFILGGETGTVFIKDMSLVESE
jgi:formylglycine-generating enzyme required for sulfatase activity/tRNA A-37 threonylcarbamoyl transferase component Bud32